MKTVRGNLITLALDGIFDVIIHGCNCQCTMTAGVAKAIRQTFPEAYEADCATEAGDRGKLGSFSAATVERNGHTITIVNGYIQFAGGGGGRLADYDAIRAVMAEVKAAFSGRRIGYPRIGAGIAGGDWDVISAIIDEELAGEDHTLVEFQP